MIKLRDIVAFVIMAVFASACSAGAAGPTAVPTATKAPPIATLVPSATFTPTATPFPWPQEPITGVNVSQLVELQSWGKGAIMSVKSVSDGSAILVDTPSKLAFYSTEALELMEEMDRPFLYEFSASSKFMVLVDNEGNIDLWSLENVGKLFTLQAGELAEYFKLEFSPNEELLAVARYTTDAEYQVSAADRKISVYSTADGALVNTLEYGDLSPVPEVIRISPDLHYLLVEGNNFYWNQLAIWDLETQEMLKRLSGLDYASSYIPNQPFSLNGASFLTFSENSVFVWDTRKVELTGEYGTGMGDIYDAGFSQDGSLITINNGEQVRRSSDGKRLTDEEIAETEFSATPLAPERADFSQYMAALKDMGYVSGLELIRANAEQEVEVWLSQYNYVFNESSGFNELQDASLSIWDPVANETALLPIPLGSPSRFYAETNGGVTCLNDQVVVFQISGEQASAFGACAEDSTLALSPNGELVAVTNGDLIELYATASGELLASLRAHSAPAFRLVFSADSSMLASYADKPRSGFNWGGGELFLWSVAEPYARIDSLTGMTEYLSVISFSPDGDYLLASEWDKVRTWRLSDGVQLNYFENPSSSSNFAFAGDLLAIGANDGSIYFWDWKTQTLIRSLAAHSGAIGYQSFRIVDLRFVLGDQALLSVSTDGTAKLWGIP